MRAPIFLCAFILPALAFAKIVRNEASRLRHESYDLKEACAYMGHAETLLVEPQGPAHIDCMGTSVSATEFCLKKMKDPSSLKYEDNPTRGVTRGLVEADTRMVTCESAAQVDVSMDCDKRDAPTYCQSSTYGCGELKKIFAYELEIEHQSIIEVESGRRLNCYFSFKAPNTDTSLKASL